MKRLVAAWVVLGSSAAAYAQDFRHDDPETHFDLVARVSRMVGDVDTNLDWGYEDLWKTGVGLSGELDLLFRMPRDWKVGPYASLGFDWFGGESARTNGGVTLEADDWLTFHLLVGGKIAHVPDRGFFFDARAGIGAVLYGEVEGELAGLPVTIFESSLAFAAEAAAHIGYSTRYNYFAIGLAGRSQAEPDKSDDLNFDGTGNAIVGSVEIEVGFRF